MRRKTATNARSKDLDYLTRHMSSLHADQERLREIQSVYDNLTLLGQLLCAGTDITGMRNDFNALARELLAQLAEEMRKKAVSSLGSNARMAIDILIRNLFERTADIGYLATDLDVRAYAQSVADAPEAEPDMGGKIALVARFGEYVRKYSVYHDIILLAPDGKVLARLDRNSDVTCSTDPLIGTSLSTEAAYVETFRATDLLPNEASPLIYSYRVMSADGFTPVGVLCLCFRFQDECRRIFESLVAEDDWTVATILDADGRVIATSDSYQFPVGAQLQRVLDKDYDVVRFAGREYLATTRPTSGYQGYMGPGWLGHTLSPLDHAFDMAEAHELALVAEELQAGALDAASLFSPELRNIPLKAERIQGELNRAVWNGNLWLSRDNYALNTSFAKVLLWEIGSTGARTRNVFSESTTNLYKTVLSSALHDCGMQAALAMDIMDRNLYERANDCRWWALTTGFREELARIDPADREQRRRITDILRTINGLYTVYDNLIVFDTTTRVVAVSNPAYADLVGTPLQNDWVRQALALPDTQSYCVSAFAPSGLYADHPTYIYSAAIREPAGTDPVGGIAIVFDARPQFEAMLKDALPRQEGGGPVDGAVAVYAERDGRIIASTDRDLAPGSRLALPRKFFETPPGEGCTDIVIHGGRYYAAGSCMSAGYREYKGGADGYRNDVVALVLSPLSDSLLPVAEIRNLREGLRDGYGLRHGPGEDGVEVATFFIRGGWYGLRSNCVVEAMDDGEITAIPGTPDWVRGCIMHHDQPISIFDLSACLPGSTAASGAAEPRQIVVLRDPKNQVSFGILADRLGEIRDIPAARIEPVPGMMAGGVSLTESLVKPHGDDPEKRILVMLSVERMLQRLSGAPCLAPTSYGALTDTGM